jgi:hypothetical protein
MKWVCVNNCQEGFKAQGLDFKAPPRQLDGGFF